MVDIVRAKLNEGSGFTTNKWPLDGLEYQDWKRPSDYPTPTIWSSMGYLYGICARQLFYANHYGYVAFSKQAKQNMQTGKDIHELVEGQLTLNPPEFLNGETLESEIKHIRRIPNTFGIGAVGAKTDLHSKSHVIEIKPIYSKTAYYQIAVEKFVNPEKSFWVYQYLSITNSNYMDIPNIIPVKADLKMAIVYVARIITALRFKPARFPKATYGNPKCRGCAFRKECYSDEGNKQLSWENFTRLSSIALTQLTSSDLAVSDLT